MKIFLWTLQFFLAFHTLTGAIWKFSNPVAEGVPTLSAITQMGWLTLGAMELICTVLFFLPLWRKRFMPLAAFAALLIAVEMVLFTVIHTASSPSEYGSVIYWLVTAAVATLLAYFRLKRA